MTPIVDRLEKRYPNEIAVIQLDANSKDGGETFRGHGMRGHPSYLLLNPAGEELWRGVGEVPASALEGEIEKHIALLGE